ncbi:unnamed protein product [Linum trigynum]|uniref:Uncharacterized protein n=1 Tax=Linum trigynum TaxID=586398 RepID=A0AAV2DU24_9ROSI
MHYNWVSVGDMARLCTREPRCKKVSRLQKLGEDQQLKSLSHKVSRSPTRGMKPLNNVVLQPDTLSHHRHGSPGHASPVLSDVTTHLIPTGTSL